MAVLGAAPGLPAYLADRGRAGVNAGVGSADAPPEVYGSSFAATAGGHVAADYGKVGYRVAWEGLSGGTIRARNEGNE
jgi:hypothetical protein